MSTNQNHSTQRTTPDPLKSTREKLARKIKTALKTTSPEETLQIYRPPPETGIDRVVPQWRKCRLLHESIWCTY